MNAVSTELQSSPKAPSDASSDLELGHFAAADLATPSSLVIASYNIRYAVGSFLISGGILRRFGITRPSRRHRLVEKNLEKATRAFSLSHVMPRPDILALQEADRRTTRAGGHDIATELAVALKMNFARAGSPTPAEEDHKEKQWYLDFEERIAKGESGDAGVAVLSRLPIIDPKRVDLPWSECPWRPRLAMTAMVPFGRTTLKVFNAHIDPHAGLEQQLEQHEAILKVADSADPTQPIALVGDFNTLIRRSRDATRAFLESRGFTSPQPSGLGTWRAGPLRLHADWIFVRNVTVRKWGVARRLRISDHWPVWAELEPQKA